MLYQILVGTAAYCTGAGALSWWLGGVFKRERSMLGLPVEQLREAQRWVATQQAMRFQEDASVVTEAMGSADSTAHTAQERRYMA